MRCGSGDMANPSVDFTLAESDADVNISWTRYMPGPALGLHSASVTDDGTRERHSITVRLGIDDCHSEYQPFTHGTLQYIIAHETGHYLGLRHIDDESHLMYSGEFFNVDSARVYDDLNLGIPYLERPEIANRRRADHSSPNRRTRLRSGSGFIATPRIEECRGEPGRQHDRVQ